MPRVSELLRDTPLRLRLRYAFSLPKAAEFWEAELKETLSRPGTSSNRSLPGEAPRKQTGRLQASVQARVRLPILSIVTTCVNYGVVLNEGNSRIAARPWVELTRKRVGDQVKHLALGGD